MDFEMVRTLTHDALKAMLEHLKGDPQYQSSGQFSADMQLNHIADWVERLAQERQHVGKTVRLTNQERKFVAHALWELVIQGILVPSSESNTGWPFVSFTDYGTRAIFAEHPTPYDPAGYLSHFNQADAVVKFYVEEALGCFRANRHTATVVMLGVASERSFDLLFESFCAALYSPHERTNLENKTKGKFVTTRYNELKKSLEPKKGQLPKDLRDNLDTVLTSIFNLIKQHRNDTGHPTGRSMPRDEAYALLSVFPHYHRQMFELTDHLQKSPGTLT